MKLLAFLLFIFFRHFPGNHEEDESKIIDDYVGNLGKRRIPVPGDGHCMLHAFSLGLREKDDQGDYSVESLITTIKNELSENKQFYSDFDAIKEEDLNAYFKNKDYNLNLVDLIPNVVANALKTSISILLVQDGQVSTRSILPKTQKKVEKTICVCKIGNHYDVIVDEEAASDLKIEGEPDIVVC